MTTENDQKMEKTPARILRPIPDGILNLVRSTPLHMPVGGWFTDALPGDDWRMTTIVRRYRDQAVQTLLSCHRTLPAPFRATGHNTI